jgi:hypothetical protein
MKTRHAPQPEFQQLTETGPVTLLREAVEAKIPIELRGTPQPLVSPPRRFIERKLAVDVDDSTAPDELVPIGFGAYPVSAAGRVAQVIGKWLGRSEARPHPDMDITCRSKQDIIAGEEWPQTVYSIFGSQVYKSAMSSPSEIPPEYHFSPSDPGTFIVRDTTEIAALATALEKAQLDQPY